MTIYTTASWFTLLFSCFPISASWNGRNGKCISLASFRGLGVTYSSESNSINSITQTNPETVLGMLTDAFLAFIPVPIISRMQLNIRTKICLYLAFGMGLATVTCGAIKSYYLWHYFNDQDRLYYNNYFVWGALELYVGTIAACLVSLKPLISSFLEKAKSTLVTSAALAKSLHHHGSPRPHSPHPASPRFEEKTEQQFNTFNTQNFPRIEICSVSDYEMPDMPVVVEQPKIFRVEMESNDVPTSLSSYPGFTSPRKSKRKHRPAPLDTEALSRRTSLELPCLGGVLNSPSPTYLPSAVDLSFLDLVKGRDPETLSRNPSVIQLPNSRFSNSTSGTDSPATMTTTSTLRSSLSVPNICGLLTSPSPTFLNSATGNDFDFFSLIRCRDPESLAAASKVPSSRRGTVISIPDSIPEDHGVSFPTSRRATLAHTRYHSVEISEASTASVQTVQRINAGEVRRRPSMAPSAASTTSAFLCPPVYGEDSQGTSMYFHVMTSGQFRSTAETAAKALEVEDAPLSPMSCGPAPKLVLREQHEYFGFSPVFDGGFGDLTAKERIDSSQAATLKKDE